MAAVTTFTKSDLDAIEMLVAKSYKECRFLEVIKVIETIRVELELIKDVLKEAFFKSEKYQHNTKNHTVFSQTDDLVKLVYSIENNPHTDFLRVLYLWLLLTDIEIKIRVISFGQGNASLALIRKAIQEVDSIGIPYSNIFLNEKIFEQMLRRCYLLPDTKEEALKYAYLLISHYSFDLQFDLGGSIFEQQRKNKKRLEELCFKIKNTENWLKFKCDEVAPAYYRFLEQKKNTEENISAAAAYANAICDTILTQYEQGSMNKTNEESWMKTLHTMVDHTVRMIKLRKKSPTLCNPDSEQLLNIILANPVSHVLRVLESEKSSFSTKSPAKNLFSSLRKISHLGIQWCSKFNELKESLDRYPSFWSKLFKFGKV
jgi:hypothetical protein